VFSAIFDFGFNFCWIELGFDMARRRSSSSESSEDEARRRSGSESEDDERDRYRRGGRSGRKSSGHRGENSDVSDSGEERNGAKRDGRRRSDRKSRSRERKEELESSEEEGQIVNKEKVREEKEEDERLKQDYDRRVGRDAEGDGRGGRESRPGNDQSERRGEKESHIWHHRDRWRGDREDRSRDREDRSRTMDRRGRHDSEEDHRELTRKSDRYSDRDRRRKGGNSERERRGRYDSEEDDRELARKSERDRDRDRRQRVERNDDNESNHRDKGVSKQQEVSRKKENGNGRTVVDANPQRQATIPGGNLNGDASNLGKSGGVYIPPFKMAMMMKEVQDKSSVEYQRLTWDALRKSINGLVNKVNATNIKNIIPELFSENLIRGRGLFCRSCMKSQMASPGFTDVFAALVAVVNTKFPEVGDLLLRRIVLQLKRAYKRNDKVCDYSSYSEIKFLLLIYFYLPFVLLLICFLFVFHSL